MMKHYALKQTLRMYILVVDCMGIVNQLKIHADAQTLADLAEQFCDRVETESRGFGILALVFDRYGTLKTSLKQQTWDSRAKNKRPNINSHQKRL